MPEPLLAVDVGTTTARAAVFTPGGVMEGIARAPLTCASPRPGRVEQDAAKVWRAARRAIADALASCGRAPSAIAAIGVTSQRTSIVVWDKATGAPLTPLVIWSDLRGAERARELVAAGFFLATQQAAAKLESVLAGVEAPRRRLAWGNIDSFLMWKLTGGAVHATDASQAWPTGYLDLATLDWNHALIAHQGLDEAMFPRLVDTWGPIGVTAPKAFGAAVPIAADIADQQSALIAHGEGAGMAKVTYGTAAALDVATGAEFMFKSPTAPPFVLSRAAGETRFCVEAMVLSAGAALDWMRGALRLGDHARFEALAASVPDAAGAAFLPALNGLGAPHGDLARRAGLTGLSAQVTAAHIARAALEGVAFRVREAFDHVFGVTGLTPPETLGADGGLTANQTFLHIQADLLGRPLRRHAIVEATAAGAALAAGRGVGLLSPADERAFTRYDKVFEPRIGADEAEERFSKWQSQVHLINPVVGRSD
ncbi:MAG: FGGY family carbohydrate kinase [Caulobacteraceae bacterium]